MYRLTQLLCGLTDALPPPQDVGKDNITLTFSHEGTTQMLTLQLPEYSGVLLDCLQGESLSTHHYGIYIYIQYVYVSVYTPMYTVWLL